MSKVKNALNLAWQKTKAANPVQLRKKIDSRIREMAIRNAKVTIATRGSIPEDLSDEQKEIIVNDEIRKIREGIKGKSLTALLIVLGLQSF